MQDNRVLSRHFGNTTERKTTQMRWFFKCITATVLLCGLLFTKAAAKDSQFESEVVQIGGTQTAMIEHSLYSDCETMYKLTAARGWIVRKLPDVWKGYRILNVQLSFNLDNNPPLIIRPSREPDRIIRTADNELSLWNVPAKLYTDVFAGVSVYYTNDRDNLFLITFVSRNWVPNTIEEPNGMHVLGVQDFDYYEAVDQKNPIQAGENGKHEYLVYKVLTDDEGLSEKDLKEYLLSLP